MSAALIISSIEALAAFAPSVPEIVTGIQTAIKLLQSGEDPTPEQKAAIDAALDAANKAVQNA